MPFETSCHNADTFSRRAMVRHTAVLSLLSKAVLMQNFAAARRGKAGLPPRSPAAAAFAQLLSGTADATKRMRCRCCRRGRVRSPAPPDALARPTVTRGPRSRRQSVTAKPQCQKMKTCMRLQQDQFKQDQVTRSQNQRNNPADGTIACSHTMHWNRVPQEAMARAGVTTLPSASR